MPEPHDPLRHLFHQAAHIGQAHADAPPFTRIAERGRRAGRRRLAGLAAACLVLAGGGVATAALVTGRPTPVVPATTPSPRDTPSAPTLSPSTQPSLTAPPTDRSTPGSGIPADTPPATPPATSTSATSPPTTSSTPDGASGGPYDGTPTSPPHGGAVSTRS
ncbi:hypothetical protein J7E93_09570 [Streptomyces sp. ISL-36]|uniref:hypothetical protein n=1 Tax=Streptomyces sp. ISL-36 TaxID=2819182 RepID=UPI001BE7D4C0|nr:hypothetical protein [Streptomyces sp. ISL-36]MBT2440352.1 hypothetical protein [Streptomyces sp. ISL-36]